MSTATLGTILRAIVTLEQEGSAVFFGEPEFDVDDVLQIAPDGQGVISLLEVSDVMDRPRLSSTFVLWLLARLCDALHEAGDQPRPKLAFFFDEAHLLFSDASEALRKTARRFPMTSHCDLEKTITSLGIGEALVRVLSPRGVPTPLAAATAQRERERTMQAAMRTAGRAIGSREGQNLLLGLFGILGGGKGR